MRELRDYQVTGLENLRQTIRQGVKRVVVQLPTGGGKTLCAATIAQGALQKKNKLAFTVPRISLIDQTLEEFYQEEVRDVGIVQANHVMTDYSKPIQICSIDTVRSRGSYPDAKIVIFDEVHLFYEAHKAWMDEHPETIFIGLSATPWKKGLGQYFDTLLVMETTKGLIDKGWLSPFRVFAAAHPDLTGVKIVAGEYHEGQLSERMQEGTLTADIVQTWKDRWGKEKTLCFAVDCAHAQAIQRRFEEAGVTADYQDARTPMDERREIKRRFHSGDASVVVSVGTLTIGVDWDVRCISMCRPTRSEMLFVQIVGRGLRTANGKQDLLLLDHSDNTQRLGFVTDIHHEHLSMGKDAAPGDKATAVPDPQPPLPKACKQCGLLRPAGVQVCPNCGFKAELVSGIVERDGELVEVTNGKRERGKKREYTLKERAQFLAELKAYGLQHGRQNGWAWHSFREKFGEPPAWHIQGVPPAAFPSMATVQWVKSRSIAWAKSKRNPRNQTKDQETRP